LDVDWLSPETGGVVRVTGTETLPVGNYFVRFQLEDSGGDIGFVPNTRKPDLWVVVDVP
jgi:hypothetical protein